MRKLEKKFANELVVVGVHSAKFPNEKEISNLSAAVRRYGLEHPVINDEEFRVWQQYSCRAWPTLMFIDPAGNVIGKHEGEMTFEQFDGLMGNMLAEFDAAGMMRRSPLPTVTSAEPEGALSFPGKVLADGGSGRLFIADTNHNRIVVSTLTGDVLQVIGSGEEDLEDGNFANAAFNHPQGMTLHGDMLYVADSESHTIRRVDLAAGQVETIAGTGDQGFERDARRDGRSVALSSPWDVAYHDGALYIAMAGIHQLWSLDLESGTIGPYAGSGRESLTDGPLATATLAQPSGITTDGHRLFFADSETSSIRSAELQASGSVRTIIGLGLFEFGDVDGTDHRVRLQHPIGITQHDGVLYVADTYNHKIKRVLPTTRAALSLIGTGTAGHVDGPATRAQFSEPSGLSVADGNIYIADTNNHAVRVAPLDGGEVSTIELAGL